MTTQVPDVLLGEDGAPELPDFALFGVKVDDIDDGLAFEDHPFLTAGDLGSLEICTSLWRGYVATLTLKADGSLVLVKFDYPFGKESRTVNKTLDGDFWLDLRESYESDGVRVPFRNGRLVRDTREWRPRFDRRPSARS